MKMVQLYRHVFDDDGNERLRPVIVGKAWLEKWLANHGETLEKFMEEYTSDESNEVELHALVADTPVFSYYADSGKFGTSCTDVDVSAAPDDMDAAMQAFALITVSALENMNMLSAADFIRQMWLTPEDIDKDIAL